MITLGVTGRSGCGKSTVTAYFQKQGIPCADADAVAREILQPGSACLAPIAAAFGADLVQNGILDRRALADRAFAVPDGTMRLNAITHPEIIARIHAQKNAAQQAGAWLFLVDAAVIVGTEFELECDKLLVVTAPPAVSVARICARDGISPEAAQRRLHAQTPECILLEKADFHIANDSDLPHLLRETQAVYSQLREEFYAQP